MLLAGRAYEALAIIEHARPEIGPSLFDQGDPEIAVLHASALAATGAEARARDVSRLPPPSYGTARRRSRIPTCARASSRVALIDWLLELAAERGL